MWVVPGLHASPFCSEPGVVSASQDTVSKVPVRAGLRPGPLCPLPWPDEANLRPTHPGSPLWTQLSRQLGSSGYNRMDPQTSGLIPMPEALRAVNGDSVPQASSLPSCFCYPWEWGLFHNYFKCGITILFLGKGCVPMELSAPKGHRLGCDWPASLPHLSHMLQVPSGGPTWFISVSF